MSKTTSSETAQSAVSMLFAVGCGGEEELGMDPESMAVAYMKAFIECDTDAALDAANIDAIKDMLWYYSGDDCSVESKAIDVRRMSSDEIKEYKRYFVKSGSFDLDNGKMVTVEMTISGSEDSFSGTVEVPVIKYNDQWIIAIPELK